MAVDSPLAIEAHGRVILPIARSLFIRAPGGKAALVWNRPRGIRVEEPGGRRYVPVPDRTRQIQWLLLGAGLALALAIRVAGRAAGRRGFCGRSG